MSNTTVTTELHLSVVLPAFNEEAVIAETVESVLQYMRRFAVWEVIVVNDGSRDRTGKIVREIAGRDQHVRLVEHEENRGYGEALRSGFNAATHDWILLMDSDGQLAIEELDAFVPKTNEYEAVLGWRANRADPWQRAVFTWGYSSLVRLLFGLGVRDVGCAFKLFKRDWWEKVQPITSTDHKVFTVEWLWKMQRSGISWCELPVKHLPRTSGQATGARLDVVVAMFREMVRLRFTS